MNRDYSCTQPGAKLLFFADETPEELFVRYEPAKGQRIHQQIFGPGEVLVKSVKARGNQLTVKVIDYVGTRKPRGWKDEEAVRGKLMNV